MLRSMCRVLAVLLVLLEGVAVAQDLGPVHVTELGATSFRLDDGFEQVTGATFGKALATYGDRLIVGKPHYKAGGVYIVGQDGQPELFLPDPEPDGRARFGSGLAIGGGGLLYVTAPPNRIVVYDLHQLLMRSPAGVVADHPAVRPIRTLVHPEVGPWLLTSHASLVTGRSHREVAGTKNAGQVVVLDPTGRELRSLVSPNPTEKGRFGAAATRHGRHLWIGAPGEHDGRGAVYVFEERSGKLVKEIRSPDARLKAFGRDIAVAAGKVAVAAEFGVFLYAPGSFERVDAIGPQTYDTRRAEPPGTVPSYTPRRFATAIDGKGDLLAVASATTAFVFNIRTMKVIGIHYVEESTVSSRQIALGRTRVFMSNPYAHRLAGAVYSFPRGWKSPTRHDPRKLAAPHVVAPPPGPWVSAKLVAQRPPAIPPLERCTDEQLGPHCAKGDLARCVETLARLDERGEATVHACRAQEACRRDSLEGCRAVAKLAGRHQGKLIPDDALALAANRRACALGGTTECSTALVTLDSRPDLIPDEAERDQAMWELNLATCVNAKSSCGALDRLYVLGQLDETRMAQAKKALTASCSNGGKHACDSLEARKQSVAREAACRKRDAAACLAIAKTFGKDDARVLPLVRQACQHGDCASCLDLAARQAKSPDEQAAAWTRNLERDTRTSCEATCFKGDGEAAASACRWVSEERSRSTDARSVRASAEADLQQCAHSRCEPEALAAALMALVGSKRVVRWAEEAVEAACAKADEPVSPSERTEAMCRDFRAHRKVLPAASADCARGKANRCVQAGLMLEMWSAGAAGAHYATACKKGSGVACVHLARMEARVGSTVDVVPLLGKGEAACQRGDVEACEAVSDMDERVYRRAVWDSGSTAREEAMWRKVRKESLVNRRAALEQVATIHREACDAGRGVSCSRAARAADMVWRDYVADKKDPDRDVAERRHLASHVAMLAKGCEAAEPDPEACAEMGTRLEHGTGGGDPDLPGAMAAYLRACQLGAAHSCRHLHASLTDGRVPADQRGRVEEGLQKACERGRPGACRN